MNSRRRVLRFNQNVTDTSAAELQRTVLAIAGVESADFNDGNLIVHYQFPETTLATILRTIKQSNVQALSKPLNRYKNLILAFMEENERDYLTYRCGWRRYLEDIYRQHFDSGQHDRIDIRKQTWRKYK
ncbi:MAG: hypothetical protein HW386_973 [Gammaproteobacteria bacterium]|nr:hypothetical protein [Gammaproteobacteria bacterium]